MSAPLVKICGVRTLHHARAAAEAGADMVGLIFAPSRRQVTPDDANAITEALHARRPSRPLIVGVFVNEEPERVAQLMNQYRLDFVQLSGHETPHQSDRLGLRGRYIKVIHVTPGMTAGEIKRKAKQYESAFAILLDAGGDGTTPAWGGTSKTVDLPIASEVVQKIRRHIILAGGLRPETVGAAIRVAQPWGVDVSSGVETDGVKDDAKIAAFVNAAKACDCGRMANDEPTAVG